jgi:hypothetical protein
MLRFRHLRLFLLLGTAGLAACSASPEALLQQINRGEATQALAELNQQLNQTPKNPLLLLLTAHARLQACAQTRCATTATPPALLQPVAGLLAAAPGRYVVGEAPQQVHLSSATVVASATLAFAALPTQPAALLALQASLPSPMQAAQTPSFWLPVLYALRQGNTQAAATHLAALGQNPALPTGLRYSATLLHSLLNPDTKTQASMLAALRAKPAQAEAASGAMALLPHLLQLSPQASVSGTLATLPPMLESSATLGPLANPSQAQAVAAELAWLATQHTLPAAWARGWNPVQQGPLGLALQRVSLRLDPLQPQVWQAYLPALIGAAASHTTLPALALPLHVGAAGSANDAQLGSTLLQAAQNLQNRPELAAPLIQLASQLKLSGTQQTQLEKLATTLLVKAATAKQISVTLALVQARPQAAANNRQLVVPLLVEHIRTNLREGAFDTAVSTSIFINQNLGLPLDLAAIALEELTSSALHSKLETSLAAPSPTVLLQPQADVKLDLGPLWGFIAQQFANRPELIRGQLNALIAGAKGVYGPPSAMHRLLPEFPAAEQPALEQWLNTAIIGALQQDTTLNGADMVTLLGQLLAIHPHLPVAPVLEAALGRANTLATSRALWADATPSLQAALHAIRPQFAALMQAMDAQAAGQPERAAQSLNQLTEPTWLSQAAPLYQGLEQRLALFAGVYVPLTANLTAPPLASVVVNPLGLQGGPLNQVYLTFLNRLGTLASTNPRTLVSTPAMLQPLTLKTPLNLETQKIDLTPAVLAQVPGGGSFNQLYGNFTTLRFQPSRRGTLLVATLANGSQLSFIRVLTYPQGVLLPDGTYTLSTPLPQNLTAEGSAAAQILPPGSLLTLRTVSGSRPAAPGSPLVGMVLPVQGWLQHPAQLKPIALSGEYDPATLSSAFRFSYPLPSSGQNVAAAVKCQTLGGPIICGAHYLHSPRLAYAALIGGQQTRESWARSTALRQAHNRRATATLLQAAQNARAHSIASPTVVPSTSKTTSPTVSASAVVSTATPISASILSANTLSPTVVAANSISQSIAPTTTVPATSSAALVVTASTLADASVSLSTPLVTPTLAVTPSVRHEGINE